MNLNSWLLLILIGQIFSLSNSMESQYRNVTGNKSGIKEIISYLDRIDEQTRVIAVKYRE